MAVYEVETLLGTKVTRGKRFYLVKWLGYPENKSSWEPEENLEGAQDLVAEFFENLLSHRPRPVDYAGSES